MIRINLLPVREERRKASARQLALVLVAAVLGSVLLSGMVHLKVRHDISSSRQMAQAMQAEIDRFGPQLAQVEEFKKTKAEIEQKLDVIQGLNEARSGPVHMLDELATHTPDRIWVTKIGIKGDRLTMEGMSLDNELGAVLHTHSLNATLLSRAIGSTLRFEGYELLKAFAGIATHETVIEIPNFANDQDINRLTSVVDNYLDTHGAVYGYLIAGHGLYTWGRSVDEALRHVEAFEFLFQCELHGIRERHA